MYDFASDRDVIANKYHKTDEPFDPFNRRAYHGYDFDSATGQSDEEILQGLNGMKSALATLPHPIAKAKAIAYVLAHTRIDINAHDYFVGFWSVDRLAKKITADAWWSELCANQLKETSARMDEMNTSGAVSIWPDFDHVVPDWDSILSLGFAGLKARAKSYREKHRRAGTLTEEMDAFFEGIDIEYQAIIDVIARLEALAKTQTHKKAKAVAQCLAGIKQGAPQNIFEAMQVMYIYFMVSESFDNYQVRSLGNGLDSTLYRFYQKDIANGTFSREEIKEFLRYFLFQWSAIGNYWGQPFYMGGTNADGSSKYNDLSRDILDVYDEMDIYNPKIQMKVNYNTPNSILNQVFDMIRRGHNCFVFCCEPGLQKAVMSYGATAEEARKMDIRGCYETGVRANEVSTAPAYVNALKPIEYVFSDGYDARLGKRFGVATGKLELLTDFDAFYSAVLAQWAHLIDMAMRTANEFEQYLGYVNPSGIYAATVESSLKKGQDAYQNGVKFNNTALLNCGMASLVDATMAVKHLVYDTQKTTLQELKKALNANWCGYESLRTKALKLEQKYGNGNAECDRYAKEMAAFFATRVNGKPNARGGVYKAIMHSALQFIWQGKLTGATPDGRCAGDEISKNASPSVGMDRNGVTALILSALHLQPYTYPESFCLDIMLHPSAVRGEEGLAAMKGLLMAYLQGDGMAIQINVFDANALRDAQAHPEQYKNLQVRVCGWNVLWNNLSTEEQNAYIARAQAVQ